MSEALAQLEYEQLLSEMRTDKDTQLNDKLIISCILIHRKYIGDNTRKFKPSLTFSALA